MRVVFVFALLASAEAYTVNLLNKENADTIDFELLGTFNIKRFSFCGCPLSRPNQPEDILGDMDAELKIDLNRIVKCATSWGQGCSQPAVLEQLTINIIQGDADEIIGTCNAGDDDCENDMMEEDEEEEPEQIQINFFIPESDFCDSTCWPNVDAITVDGTNGGPLGDFVDIYSPHEEITVTLELLAPVRGSLTRSSPTVATGTSVSFTGSVLEANDWLETAVSFAPTTTSTAQRTQEVQVTVSNADTNIGNANSKIVNIVIPGVAPEPTDNIIIGANNNIFTANRSLNSLNCPTGQTMTINSGVIITTVSGTINCVIGGAGRLVVGALTCGAGELGAIQLVRSNTAATGTVNVVGTCIFGGPITCGSGSACRTTVTDDTGRAVIRTASVPNNIHFVLTQASTVSGAAHLRFERTVSMGAGSLSCIGANIEAIASVTVSWTGSSGNGIQLGNSVASTNAGANAQQAFPCTLFGQGTFALATNTAANRLVVSAVTTVSNGNMDANFVDINSNGNLRVLNGGNLNLYRPGRIRGTQALDIESGGTLNRNNNRARGAPVAKLHTLQTDPETVTIDVFTTGNSGSDVVVAANHEVVFRGGCRLNGQIDLAAGATLANESPSGCTVQPEVPSGSSAATTAQIVNRNNGVLEIPAGTINYPINSTPGTVTRIGTTGPVTLTQPLNLLGRVEFGPFLVTGTDATFGDQPVVFNFNQAGAGGLTLSGSFTGSSNSPGTPLDTMNRSTYTPTGAEVVDLVRFGTTSGNFQPLVLAFNGFDPQTLSVSANGLASQPLVVAGGGTANTPSATPTTPTVPTAPATISPATVVPTTPSGSSSTEDDNSGLIGGLVGGLGGGLVLCLIIAAAIAAAILLSRKKKAARRHAYPNKDPYPEPFYPTEMAMGEPMGPPMGDFMGPPMGDFMGPPMGDFMGPPMGDFMGPPMGDMGYPSMDPYAPSGLVAPVTTPAYSQSAQFMF